MNEIVLNETQFQYVIEGWDREYKTITFLKAVFVEAIPINEAAEKFGLNSSYAYRISREFKKRMHNRLEEDGLKLEVVFTKEKVL